VPLVEIVSRPDLRTPEEAYLYLQRLRSILRYTGVCDGNLEEGSLRCDANVSVRARGESALRTRREIKNMNSFRFVEMAVAKEVAEQIAGYEAGGTIQQSTRLFDGQTQELRTMRGKEDAQDYRYFPDPDLPPLRISSEKLAAIRAGIGELPEERLARYQNELGLNAYDAGVMVEHKALGDYLDELVRAGLPAKTAANWTLTDLQGALRESGLRLETCGLSPKSMAALLRLVEAGVVNRATAKSRILPLMITTGREAEQIVREEGLAQVSDSAAIENALDAVLAKESGLVNEYRAGKDAVLNAIFGRVMRALGGKGNPAVIRPALEKRLKALRTG